MDFNDTPEEAAFRKEVRAWLDANATRKSDDKQSFRARNDDPELLKKAKEWQAKKAAAWITSRISRSANPSWRRRSTWRAPSAGGVGASATARSTIACQRSPSSSGVPGSTPRSRIRSIASVRLLSCDASRACTEVQ